MQSTQRKIQYLIAFVMIFIGVDQAIAQDHFIPNIVPPSPNAAALGKYGEIPVDLYRGYRISTSHCTKSQSMILRCLFHSLFTLQDIR